jgi:hypothetical protein
MRTPSLRTRSEPFGDLLQYLTFLIVVLSSQQIPNLAALEDRAGANRFAVRVIDPESSSPFPAFVLSPQGVPLEYQVRMDRLRLYDSLLVLVLDLLSSYQLGSELELRLEGNTAYLWLMVGHDLLSPMVRLIDRLVAIDYHWWIGLVRLFGLFVAIHYVSQGETLKINKYKNQIQ